VAAVMICIPLRGILANSDKNNDQEWWPWQ
jgi:hypothetical protein